MQICHRIDKNCYSIFICFSLLFYASICLVLLQKVKNIIQWKRGSSLSNLDRISLMRNDLDELKENERQLDNLIEKIKINSKRQSESKQAYVTCQDLHNIDMYNDQVIMVVKAPPETQLILMDGNPPPVVLKSEKDEIDIFFCPDPSAGGLQPAAASLNSSDDEEASTSVRQHRKVASSTTTKRNGVGSAQRNLLKAFDETGSEPKATKSKSNLFSQFNATVRCESSDEGLNRNEDTEEDDEDITTTTKPFKSTTITTKDLMLLNDPSSEELEPSYGIKKDVKLSLFSPQKGGSWTDTLPDLGGFSPSYPFSHSDDPAGGFFPLEPDAGYNFLLAESEGIMDLFDYNI